MSRMTMVTVPIKQLLMGFMRVMRVQRAGIFAVMVGADHPVRASHTIQYFVDDVSIEVPQAPQPHHETYHYNQSTSAHQNDTESHGEPCYGALRDGG